MPREIRMCTVSGDYDGALSVFNEMVSVVEYGGKPPLGVYCDIMHRYAAHTTLSCYMCAFVFHCRPMNCFAETEYSAL